MEESSLDPVRPFYWDVVRDVSMDRHLLQREHAFVRLFLGASMPPLRVLEVGCGSGRITLLLHDMGLNVVGLDVHPVPLAAFQRQSNAVSLVQANALRLPFVDTSYDCVVGIQVLDYMALQPFLQECNRVLCNAGLLIFQALNRWSYKSMLKRLVGRRAERRISRSSLCSREVLHATVGHGFELQAVSGYNWGPFRRESNSPLVWLAALIEQKLGLDRYCSISPWILVAARKKTTPLLASDEALLESAFMPEAHRDAA
jgi:ubiquinone/menaquinone biosynthesis C-methylase UbiE